MGKLILQFDEALEICEQVREINKKKKISFNKLWCWGCTKFTKSSEKRCFANSEDGGNNGCTQVNKLYKKIHNQ
ncbi:MAG: hypothetical protein ACFFE4_23635 [Candidatus Thorarchaeota archaeon]